MKSRYSTGAIKSSQPSFPLLLISALLLTGCPAQEAIEQAFRDPPKAPGTDPISPGPSCFNDRFVQPRAQITRKLDLLFVVDTSASLFQEKEQIVLGIDSFLNALPSNIDLRLGVLLAHSELSPWGGRLYQHGSEPVVLDSAVMTREQLRYGFAEKMLLGQPGEYVSDGGEAMLYGMNQLLKSENVDLARSEGFFRTDSAGAPEAALAVVFVSDEQDICYPGTAYDGEHLEAPFLNTKCSNATETISAELVYQKLVALQGDKPLALGAVAYVDPSKVPAGAENEVGTGLLDIVDLNSGVKVEMADGDYQNGLAALGTLTTYKLNLVYDFTLSQVAERIDTDSIEVFVDGAGAMFNYIVPTNQVHVPNPGIAESAVDISYCLKQGGGCTGLGCGGEV